MLSYKQLIQKLNEAVTHSYHWFHVTHPETGKNIDLSGLHKINRKVVTGIHENGKIAMYGNNHKELHKLIADHLEKKGIQAKISYTGTRPYNP